MKTAFGVAIFLFAFCLGAHAQDEGKVFRAGAATANTTPFLGTPLEGVISKAGPATYVHDELHARAIVIDDGTTRLAMVICDNTMISREIHDRAKHLINQATGLATNRILISATHTHSAPRALVNFQDNELHAHYLDFLARRIADSVQCAISNLAPAKIAWGSGQKPEHIFNRRYHMAPAATLKNPFGDKTDKVQMNPKPGGEHILQPAGPTDPEVYIISIQHVDGRPLALLANYGLHYIGDVGPGHVSADYFGMFADRMQQLFGADRQKPAFVAIMSNGTSGDVNGINFLKPEPNKGPYEKMRAVAFSVANEVNRVSEQMVYTNFVPLACFESELELAVRKPSEARIEWARKNAERTYGRETLELAKYPDTVPVKLQVMRIGDLAIAAVPCEVFAQTGLDIKKQSPFKSTFTISLANGYNGYLPTTEGHEQGGYETWAARNSFLEVPAADKIQAGILELLKTAKSKSAAD
jgi:neutral ceramidase